MKNIGVVVLGTALAVIACAGDVLSAASPADLTTHPIAPHPNGPFAGAAGAWDPEDAGLICMGGYTAVSSNGTRRLTSQLWKFSTRTQQWILLDEGAEPGPRYGSSAVYSVGSGLTVVGGRRRSACPDSVWNFDIRTGEWAAHSRPATGDLFTRHEAGMVADPRGGLWYGYGGCGFAHATNGLYHRLPGDQQFQLIQRTIEPHPRAAQVLAYDTRRNAVVVYGGRYYYGLGVNAAEVASGEGEDCGQRPALVEVWSLDSSSRTWSRLSRAGEGLLQERSLAFGAYSPASDALVVVGGVQTGYGCRARYSPGHGVYLGTVAAFSLRDHRWQEYSVSADIARTEMAGAYAPDLGQVIVAGGLGVHADSSEGVPRADGFVIQVEQMAQLRLHGNHRGLGGSTVVDLEFERPNPPLIDLRILNVVTGESNAMDAKVKRKSDRAFQLHLPREWAHRLAADPQLRLVGGFEGEVLGFLSRPIQETPEERTPRSNQLHAADPPHVRKTRVRFGGSTFELESPLEVGSVVRFTLHDVRGRRLHQGEARVVVGGEREYELMSPGFKGGLDGFRGLFFVRLADDQGTRLGSGRVMLLPKP